MYFQFDRILKKIEQNPLIQHQLFYVAPPKGQLISKRLLEKIVWTKLATKKFDNFYPGGQIKKIKTLYYIKYPIIDIKKCIYFFDLTTTQPGQKLSNFFVAILVQTMTPRRHFEII